MGRCHQQGLGTALSLTEARAAFEEAVRRGFEHATVRTHILTHSHTHHTHTHPSHTHTHTAITDTPPTHKHTNTHNKPITLSHTHNTLPKVELSKMDRFAVDEVMPVHAEWLAQGNKFLPTTPYRRSNSLRWIALLLTRSCLFMLSGLRKVTNFYPQHLTEGRTL